jgi:hypothetical protein
MFSNKIIFIFQYQMSIHLMAKNSSLMVKVPLLLMRIKMTIIRRCLTMNQGLLVAPDPQRPATRRSPRSSETPNKTPVPTNPSKVEIQERTVLPNPSRINRHNSSRRLQRWL